MCYSAQIWADYKKYVRTFGADISVRRYVELFWEKKKSGDWQKIPKAMKAAFAVPRTEEEREVHALIAETDEEQALAFESVLFQQKTRLTGAERVMASGKPTKKAESDVRVAGNKIEQAQRKLSDLRRTELLDRDSRIYPGQYAPVMIRKDGKRLVVPMRYQCRMPGWTEAVERKYPGTYNARRDNLEKAWGQLFGYHHGIMVVTKFYENVERDGKNVVLEFDPQPPREMLVACLWSFSKGGEGEADLFSFAAITDEPPPEVLAAGQDRCIVPIKPENIDAWLTPDPTNLAAQYAILDDRARPYYEHQMAA
ncbi:SOS response-associated peptidase family protein [Rhodanobacter sp. MP7CTX1]|uniref:SOS response-associated peptidase family protein n=1 Tax=Rhodanobacter sp. MP7CTX1 TaxID=2723084 RepID=UPI001609898C|nr:SOS response-associated peptidase family protein [Rhodanobacter sp. MP7CTX1]MBB6186981.1 putative SOS response-associated peptidase YedK [Rhodanobacter sp. MP7CTX1]